MYVHYTTRNIHSSGLLLIRPTHAVTTYQVSAIVVTKDSRSVKLTGCECTSWITITDASPTATVTATIISQWLNGIVTQTVCWTLPEFMNAKKNSNILKKSTIFRKLPNVVYIKT